MLSYNTGTVIELHWGLGGGVGVGLLVLNLTLTKQLLEK